MNILDITQSDPFTLPSVPIEELNNLPETSGIYFVLAEGQVLYIGQSTGIRQRWQAHHKTQELGSYSQVRIAWLEAEYGELTEIEKAYIEQFKPSLNFMSVPRKRTQKTIYLPPALAKRLNFASVEEEREISEIVTDALEAYFKNKAKENN